MRRTAPPTHPLSLLQVVQLLKSFKGSTNAHEQEVFACMIHNLFDEYRFFPRYPDKVGLWGIGAAKRVILTACSALVSPPALQHARCSQ